MNRKYLKDQGFTDEQIDIIMAEHGRTISRYVPKSEVETLNTQLAGYKDKTAIDPKELEILNSNASKAATLEQQVAALTAEKTSMQKTFDVKTKLMTAKAKDADLLLPKLDLTKDNIDEQIKTLQQSHGYMFGDVVPNNPNPNPPGGMPPAGGQDAEIAALKAMIDKQSF